MYIILVHRTTVQDVRKDLRPLFTRYRKTTENMMTTPLFCLMLVCKSFLCSGI